MLPKSFRLKRSTIFPKTLSSGKVVCNTPYFVMLGLPRVYASATPTRIGIVVSRKVSNRANQRNKARRRLRELIRQRLIPRLEAFQSYIAIVFIARKPILEASYSELQNTFIQCIESR